MSNQVPITVEERNEHGKNPSRRLRAAGKVPGVVYGNSQEPIGVQVDPRPLEAVISSDRGLNSLIQLAVEGTDFQRTVLLREVQRHPVTEAILHADFLCVQLDKPIEATVPIELVGEADGVKNAGGVLEFVRRELAVFALPAEIPNKIVHDITELGFGQKVEASDLPIPDGVELRTAPTDTICTISGKQVEEEEPVADEAVEGEEAAEGDAAEESGEGAESAES